MAASFGRLTFSIVAWGVIGTCRSHVNEVLARNKDGIVDRTELGVLLLAKLTRYRKLGGKLV